MRAPQTPSFVAGLAAMRSEHKTTVDALRDDHQTQLKNVKAELAALRIESVELSAGLSKVRSRIRALADTEAATRRATELIRSIEGVKDVTWVLGEPAPRVYYNAINNTRGVEGLAASWAWVRGVGVMSYALTARQPVVQRAPLACSPPCLRFTLPGR